MVPKRNEVCDIDYVVPGWQCKQWSNMGDVYNVPFQVDGIEVTGHCNIVNYLYTVGDTKVAALPATSFPNFASAFLTDAVVEMSFYPQNSYHWEFQNGNRFSAYPQDNGSEKMKMPYWYQQNVEPMYYGIYANYALQINCKLQRTMPHYIPTVVDETTAAVKQVQAVTYVNLQGQQSQEPFSGLNVKVTRYADGSTTSCKEMH